MLSSDEIRTMITAMGTGIGKDEFNIEKLRYHRIVIMTDADVDGSHILTLILTFFFRQMPDIIANGYLYIAQPPLYKTKKGKAEAYIQNDADLTEKLLDLALDKIKFARGGELKEFCTKVISLRSQKNQLTHNPKLKVMVDLFYKNNQKLESTNLSLVYKVMQDMLKENPEEGLMVHLQPEREEMDILYQDKRFPIDQEDLESLDTYVFNKILDRFIELDELKEDGNFIISDDKDETMRFSDAISLVDHIISEGKKGVYIQRYKGLGEMNPEQLWETTMDPKARKFLQVSIEDAVEADEVFTTLMGDQVDIRRAFIENNALKVRNLDI